MNDVIIVLKYEGNNSYKFEGSFSSVDHAKQYLSSLTNDDITGSEYSIVKALENYKVEIERYTKLTPFPFLMRFGDSE